ncbi:MAG TPA: hypothetical protein GXX76_10660 [Bacteroidales bacterium]|jgi:hypothetical protein|nr:hypothetical protein [Bacteroidales bacterium]HHX98804.1 hypothetical protein [Lentisphaerota bacterium]
MKYFIHILAAIVLAANFALADAADDWLRVDGEIEQLMESDAFNPADALSLATNNLLLAENTFGATHRNTAIALYKVAWLARQAGSHKLGNDSYTRCWKLWEEIIPSDIESLGRIHPQVAENYRRAGVAFQNSGMDERAKECYLKYMEISEALYATSPTNDAYLSALYFMAEIYHYYEDTEKRDLYWDKYKTLSSEHK